MFRFVALLYDNKLYDHVFPYVYQTMFLHSDGYATFICVHANPIYLNEDNNMFVFIKYMVIIVFIIITSNSSIVISIN